MEGGNFGWIELALFYGFAIAFAAWQYIATDRLLKKTRAEKAAKDAAAKRDEPPAT
ncbi:MAG: hypothetical protein MUF47_04790 [Porphyrobacter sp.]|jgi:hypothetical protein|nr:hypothetical protein [Porphyrobacter sp.]